jgi:hypothetical protein
MSQAHPTPWKIRRVRYILKARCHPALRYLLGPYRGEKQSGLGGARGGSAYIQYFKSQAAFYPRDPMRCFNSATTAGGLEKCPYQGTIQRSN